MMAVAATSPVLRLLACAIAHGESIRALYVELRADPPAARRAALLEQAHAHAEKLGGVLRDVAAQRSRVPDNADVREALQALGELMEQVMIAEREYRIGAGGANEPAAPTAAEQVS